MSLELVLLLMATLLLGVKLVFRWRTWHDRGLTVLFLTLALAGLIVLGPGKAAGDYVVRITAGPWGFLLVSAGAIVAGLMGMSPFLFALLAAAAEPGRQLAVSLVIPMTLANLPHALFLVWTMPPRELKDDV